MAHRGKVPVLNEELHAQALGRQAPVVYQGVNPAPGYAKLFGDFTDGKQLRFRSDHDREVYTTADKYLFRVIDKRLATVHSLSRSVA